MKKAFLMGAAALTILSLSACGVGNVSVSGAKSASSVASAVSSHVESKAPAVSVDASKYPDTLKGLAQYLNACGYLKGDGTRMEAQLIGAENGYRYTNAVKKKETISIELYAFQPANLNETAKKVLDEVKQNGAFTLFQKKVPAILSDNGKYLMVYQDSASDAEGTARAKAVKEKFQAFHAEA